MCSLWLHRFVDKCRVLPLKMDETVSESRKKSSHHIPCKVSEGLDPGKREGRGGCYVSQEKQAKALGI